jgi:hypothetical protein
MRRTDNNRARLMPDCADQRFINCICAIDAATRRIVIPLPARESELMTPTAFLTADVLIAYSAYFVGTASPGPSNLAIMSLAMSAGRRSALTFALGVVSGSFFWALLASLGLSALLAT